MSAFTLDTSGYVQFEVPHTLDVVRRRFEDHDPFTQGAINEASRELYERLIREGWTPETASAAVAFHNWSPSALERIVRDCGSFLKGCEGTRVWGFASDGRLFWEGRQRGHMPANFPPLTVSLEDAGKVTLADQVPA